MKTIIIAGGNSGIGLESARGLSAAGHRVVLLGRSAAKGDAALEHLKGLPGKAEFLAVDLATHDGVRSAASRLLSAYPRVDALLHTSGVLIMEEARTGDGLHPFFAVNYLSRYHLTQRLLPALRKSDSGRVIMLSAKVNLKTRIDFGQFPRFEPFKFARMKGPIQFGNHHYAVHLKNTEPSLLAGVVNAGVAKTDIWRETPLPMRILSSVLGPLFFDSLPTTAIIPADLCVRESWPSGSYWGKPGRTEVTTLLDLNPEQTAELVAKSHELTGV